MNIDKYVLKFKEFTEGYDEELLEGFVAYLTSRIEALEKQGALYDEVMVEKMLDDRLQRIYEYPIEYKKKMLIKDNYNEEIYKIYNHIFELAKNKYSSNSTVRK